MNKKDEEKLILMLVSLVVFILGYSILIGTIVFTVVKVLQWTGVI